MHSLFWKSSHLSSFVHQAIKFLQQAVGLRGYAAKDPLTEFKLEGYNLFVEMAAQVTSQLPRAEILMHATECTTICVYHISASFAISYLA